MNQKKEEENYCVMERASEKTEKEYEYRGKLKDVADVTEEYFLLIHKSYLINMEHVEHYEYDNVVMKDKTRLSISKANRKKVRERLLQTEKKRL